MQKHYKFSIWYVLLGIWVVLLVQNYIASMFAAQIIPYSQFLNLLKAGKVTEIAVTANQIQGKMKIDGETGDFKLFKTIHVDPDLSAMLEQYPVSFKGEIESTFLRDLFSWIFPLLLFVGVWYFLMKRMGGQQAGFMTLGKNKAKIYMENELNVTFADVAGVDEAKQELVEVIEFLRRRASSRESAGAFPRASCWSVRPEAARPCWPRRSPARAAFPFSAFPVRNSSRCSSASARPVSGTFSPRPRERPPASSLSTNSTRWGRHAVSAPSAVTTSGNRPSTNSWSRWTGSIRRSA